MMLTRPSAATRTKAVGLKAAGGACGACAKISATGSRWRAKRTPPPATAENRKKERRSRSVPFMGPPSARDAIEVEGDTCIESIVNPRRKFGNFSQLWREQPAQWSDS